MEPALYQAAMKDDINVLIRYQDQFETQLTPKGNTVLHITAMNGKTQGVDEILRTCPSLLRKVNSQDETPLHVAARAGHAGIVQALFDFVDRQNNDIGVREMLGEKNVNDDTAFHVAVQNGHLDVVKLLLEKDPTFLYRPNLKEETPLYLAGKKGFKEIVSEILKICTSPLYGGPSPLYGGPYSRTVLHAAVIFGSRECTEKLLNWRESLAKEVDAYLWTPLHYAAFLGHAQLVKNLLDLDKSVAYLKTGDRSDENTALHIAASQGHVNVVKVLLSSCPDCWEIDNIIGQNILDIAVENNKYDVVKYIKKNSSLNGLINGKDNADNTCDPLVLSDSPRIETPNSGVINSVKDRAEALRKAGDTQMIVAALIATITFTAGVTVPGGYYGNDGPNPGMAILSRTAAFKGFFVTNTVALGLSVIAILCYFDAAWHNHEKRKLEKRYRNSGLVVLHALAAMTIAYVTGTYAVLDNSLDIAIATCVLGSIIVLISYLYNIWYALRWINAVCFNQYNALKHQWKGYYDVPGQWQDSMASDHEIQSGDNSPSQSSNYYSV